MAIIYSYPTVTPTKTDLILGTDVSTTNKATKNFTVQSIVDIVTAGAVGIGATIKLTNPLGNAADPVSGANQPIINLSNITGSGTSTFNTFTDGTMTITGGLGTGFTSITSTDFVGNITGIVKAGSSIAGTAGGTDAQNVLGVTQNAGDNSLRLATTAYVDGKVDPSILTFAGTSGGNQTVNLAAQTFSLLGTANQIESVSTAQTITFRFPAAGAVLPNGSTATTQAATDDSTKVATTAFVRDYDDLQDLDFSGTTGTGAVVLNSQTLAIAGTANQVVTSAAGQTLTIALTNPIVTNLTGNVTGTILATSNIAGVAGGTDAQNVLAVTQTAGNNSTRIATTAYVDAAAGAKTLTYEGDAVDPFDLNLSTDTLKLKCSNTNITVTANAVNANKGVINIDLSNNVGISGTMTAGTFTDGTFTGSAGTYTGYASITSTDFVGALTGNATTATALASPGTIQLLSGSGATQGVASNAITYTSGGNVQLTTSLANTTVTSKTLLNLPTPTSSAIAAGDTVLEAMAKLQGQINASGGGGSIAYEGAWRASVTAVANGAVSSSTALVITTADANLVKGTVVEGAGITGTVRIDSIAGTSITLDTAITIADGITLTMSPPGGAITGATAGTAASLTTPANKVNGRFYICDTSGKAEPNAAVPWAAATTPNEWAVGDWVIYISSGTAADEWQKIDQSNEIFGSGSTNKIAKWTASNTLGTGLIEDDGTTVTIGANGNLTVLGDTILGDDAAADTITLNGPTTFESTGIFKKGIGLGGAVYGAAGQVLTSGGGSGNANTWTTPTTGTVTSVGLTETGDALTITNSPITTTGNINIAGAGASTQYINGELNLVTFPTLDNYVSWTLAGDTGTSQTISSTNTATFAGGFGISTVASATDTLTTAIDIAGTDNAIAGLTAATPVATDTLWFNDISDSNTIRKATISDIVDLGNETLAQVLSNGNTTGGTDIAVSAADDITFADNSRALFGDGTDLFIFHDASNSIIAAAGTGNLNISTNSGSVKINNSNIETMAEFAVDGAVDLYYNGSKKFNTTSGGVTVTGSTTLGGSVLIEGNVNMDGYYISDVEEIRFDQGSNQAIIASPSATSLEIKGANVSITGGGSNPVDGNLTVAGDLTVNGAIIHGGGGAGIFTGSKAINSSAAATAFTLQRSTGTLIFDVWLTSETSTATSVAKKYTVAHSYGTTPVYNKIIDTGPDGSNDFTVTFVNAGTGGDSVNCSIISNTIAAQTIGYTVQVGHDGTNTLTFTAG